jgi:hypothetical protein
MFDCDDKVTGSARVFDKAQALDQSLIIESSIVDPGEQAVSVEVIKLVCVNFASEDFLEKDDVRLNVLGGKEARDILSRNAEFFLELVDKRSDRI